MPRWLRWLLIGAVAAVALVVLVLALLPTFIDVNRYKGQVIAQVEAALGREITLGRLSLGFLPTPTLGLEELVIGERAAPAQGPIPPGERFVTLDRLGLKLRLLPLLRRRIEVTRLILERPQITVDRDAKGNLSVADLGGVGGAAPPAGPQAGRPAGPSPLAALLVRRIEVRQGSLTFRDRAVVPGREVTTTVTDLAAALDDVSLDRPIRADVKATFLSRTPQNVALAGTLGPFGAQVDLLAAPADLSLRAAELDLDQVAAYVGARTGAPKPTTPGGPAEALSVGGTGGLTATVKGPLGAPAVDAAIDLTPAAVAYAGAFTKKAGVPLVLKVTTKAGQAGQGTPVVEVDPLTLTLHTLTLTAKGRIANPTSPVVDLAVKSNEARLSGWEGIVPALAGASLGGRATLEATVVGRPLEPDALDVAGTLRAAGLELRHPSLPQPLTDGDATLRFTGTRASLEPLRAKLGGSPFTLTAEIPELSRRYVRFALESPKLDLDPLITAGAAAGGEAPRPTPPPARPSRPPARGAAGGPGAAVAGLAADGTLRVAKGTLRGVSFTDLRGDVKLRDRVFALERLVFGLYGGQYVGSGTADLRGRAPVLDFTSKLDHVKTNEILSDTTSVKGIVFGLLSANLKVKGQGLDADSLLASLSGDGKFSLTDGRIVSFDMLDRLQALVALARDGEAPPAPAAGAARGTPVKSLSSGVRIDKGKFVTPDLSLSTGDFGLAGSGAVGFDQSLAYELKATLPAPLARQVLGKDLARLLAADATGAVQIPFRMAGTLAAPTFSLSGRVLQEQIRSRLEQAAGEKLQRGLEQFLRGRGADQAGGAAPGGSPAPGGGASPAPADPRQLLKDLLKK